jgi:hypothetical protein
MRNGGIKMERYPLLYCEPYRCTYLRYGLVGSEMDPSWGETSCDQAARHTLLLPRYTLLASVTCAGIGHVFRHVQIPLVVLHILLCAKYSDTSEVTVPVWA